MPGAASRERPTPSPERFPDHAYPLCRDAARQEAECRAPRPRALLVAKSGRQWAWQAA